MYKLVNRYTNRTSQPRLPINILFRYTNNAPQQKHPSLKHFEVSPSKKKKSHGGVIQKAKNHALT